MNRININWRELSEMGSHGILYANVLGYYLLLEPVRTMGGARTTSYSVTYTTAGNPNDAWPIEPSNDSAFKMPSSSQEAAKQAAAMWLSEKIRDVCVSNP